MTAADLILVSVVEDLEYLTSDDVVVPMSTLVRNNSGLCVLRKLRDAGEGWVLYRPSDWVGRRLSGSERKQFMYALRELEDDELVLCERNAAGRTIRIALTEAGEKKAYEILDSLDDE